MLFVWISEAEAGKENWWEKFTEIILTEPAIGCQPLDFWSLTKGWQRTHFQGTKQVYHLNASQILDNVNRKLEIRSIPAIKELLQQTYSTVNVYKHLAFQSSPEKCGMRIHSSWPLVHDEKTYYIRPMQNHQWQYTKEETWIWRISPWYFLIILSSSKFPAQGFSHSSVMYHNPLILGSIYVPFKK